MTRPSKRFVNKPPAQQAGILCNDPRFQKFASTRSGFPGGQFKASAAAEYLRHVCRIDSRADLNWNNEALDRFRKLQAEFDKWTGRIGDPRDAA